MPEEETYEQTEETHEDDDIYEDKGAENLEEDDEISPEEEAFMKGYNEAGKSEKENSDEEDY